MVIFGPCARIRVTATHTPATAATIGTTHTTESRVRFRVTVLDSDTDAVGPGMLHLAPPRGTPYQPRVEASHRKHRQPHHRREEEEPEPGFDRHERLELHERRREGVD